jgi:hypothetical protein
MRRKRIPQSLIREAQKRIDRIRENMEELRAQEGKGRANDYLRAERTASMGQDAIRVLIRAGMPLPAWSGKIGGTLRRWAGISRTCRCPGTRR